MTIVIFIRLTVAVDGVGEACYSIIKGKDRSFSFVDEGKYSSEKAQKNRCLFGNPVDEIWCVRTARVCPCRRAVSGKSILY
jgi:hypothetical protein